MLFKQAQGALPDDIPSAKPQSHAPGDIPSAKQTTTTNTGVTPQMSAQWDSKIVDAVREMQTSIIIFSKTLTDSDIGKEHGTQELLHSQNGESRPPDHLGGVSPFGSFLLNQYVNKAQVFGDQYVNVDLPEPARSTTAIRPVNLAGIATTIARIGTPGKDTKPDGIWQTRTNNALKAICAVGVGLMQFAKDMGNIKSEDFSEADLKKLEGLIPDNYTDLHGTAGQRALEIRPLIDSLTKWYLQFQTAVLEHPQLRALINQETAFADHSQYLKTELSSEDAAFIEANRALPIPGVNINGKPVRLADIENITAFRDHFLKDANVDVGKPDAVQQYLAVIKNSLQGTELGAGF